MFVQPDDLPNALVGEVASKGWAIEPGSVRYAAVGFGSHHWHGIGGGRPWFLTVDEVDDGGARLLAALATAAGLRDHDRDWVIAPRASIDGALVKPINDRYVLAVYPWVDGASGSFGAFNDRSEREAVIDRLAELHRADVSHTPTRTHDLTVPARHALVDALADLASPWSSGPFAERTRSLLDTQRNAIASAFDTYDRLVAVAGSEPQHYCITHGEPHPGNVIFTTDGPALVDWDTALLAPPERDLWRIIDEDASSRSHYEDLSDRTLDNQALELYRLWWDLCEVSLFTADFRSPHTDTKDATTAWQGLQNSVEQLARLVS